MSSFFATSSISDVTDERKTFFNVKQKQHLLLLLRQMRNEESETYSRDAESWLSSD